MRGFQGSALRAAQVAFLDEVCADPAPAAAPGVRGRMDIYRRPYWKRMLECVTDDFPRARASLGDVEFARAARAFVAEGLGGARYATIARIGERFPRFLHGTPAWRAAAGAALRDWIYLEANRGPRPEFAAARQLATLDPDLAASSRLLLNPGIRWGRVPGVPGAWLAWAAPDGEVRVRRASAARVRMLQRAARGWSVSRIAEADGDAARVSKHFREAIAWGLVVAIATPGV